MALYIFYNYLFSVLKKISTTVQYMRISDEISNRVNPLKEGGSHFVEKISDCAAIPGEDDGAALAGRHAAGVLNLIAGKRAVQLHSKRRSAVGQCLHPGSNDYSSRQPVILAINCRRCFHV